MEGKPFAPLFDAPASVGSACSPRVDLEAMAGRDGAARRLPRTLPTNRKHLARNGLFREEDRPHQCPNVPVARGYDLGQSIEQFWIIVPPLVWPMKVADMSPISICGSRLGIATMRYRCVIRVTTHKDA